MDGNFVFLYIFFPAHLANGKVDRQLEMEPIFEAGRCVRNDKQMLIFSSDLESCNPSWAEFVILPLGRESRSLVVGLCGLSYLNFPCLILH